MAAYNDGSPSYDFRSGGHYGASASIAALGHPSDPQLFTGSWQNVNQALQGTYRDILKTYWQQVTELENDEHDYKLHQLPLARIKKVMKADPEVKMISAEAPISFAKGCDIFSTELTMPFKQVARPKMLNMGSHSWINKDRIGRHSEHPFRRRNLQSHSSQKRHYEIPGTLANKSVVAFPDTGSGLNVVSLDFAKRNKLRVDPSLQSDFLLPTGQSTRSVGSVKLPWVFTGESKVFDVVFSVLPKCTHDIILGKDFLRFTQTLTRFVHRITSRLLPFSPNKGVRLLGSQRERVWGMLNDECVAAIPDTGSDVMLMSKSYAKLHNFPIRAQQHLRSELEFADGSRAWTSGMVTDLDWSFGGSYESYQCDFHVLDDLVVDVVLSNDFLFDTDAFSAYAPSFYEEDSFAPEFGFELSLVKQISWLGNSFRRLFREKPSPEPVLDADQPEAIRKELQRRDDAEEFISSLASEEQTAAKDLEKHRRDIWQRSWHPCERTRLVQTPISNAQP